MIKTSTSHPLQIASCPTRNGGAIGLSLCPGKWQRDALSGEWQRDLESDISVIAAWGADVVVTLIEMSEMRDLRVTEMRDVFTRAGMRWLHHPLPDGTAPTTYWVDQWMHDRASIHSLLAEGGRVFVHCKGGLGRAGLLAAILLVDDGKSADDAIAEVRRRRSAGAIETREQEDFVRSWEASAY